MTEQLPQTFASINGVTNEDWDRRLLGLAQFVASWSTDRSTKVGAVIADRNHAVCAVGFNTFAHGTLDLDERHERPAKYLWTEHAERNAIFDAARRGVATDGCAMYVPWFPCMDCARAIVQSGIRRLVAIHPDLSDERWGEHFETAMQLFTEASVKVEFLEVLP